MPRSAWIMGALVALLLGGTVWHSKNTRTVPEEPAARAAPAPAAPVASGEEQNTAPVATVTPPSNATSTFPDGRSVPELPAGAPKSVSFGVVLLAYRGAELAPSDARSKEAALAKAKELLGTAQKDFDDAVKKGDRGSTSQAGAMPRGVLDPSLEYVLFTLKKGEVYGEPVDTPRGYWILRRTD
jgi:hypothetical protein